MREGFTIYDTPPIQEKFTDKKYSLRYLVVTNLISFSIGIGFYYLASKD
jgi:hypothetical protein